VYSTCSTHQRENEDVVMAVMPAAKAKGFELACPYPSWPHRGLPVFEGGKMFSEAPLLLIVHQAASFLGQQELTIP
jgi:16S rRNA C967 or C1407 C5-methylase (RsmB/RsmF family)